MFDECVCFWHLLECDRAGWPFVATYFVRFATSWRSRSFCVMSLVTRMTFLSQSWRWREGRVSIGLAVAGI
ncbi:MAG: hypothetical protein DI563_05675 [Variovorax paradoxus]|uniref:Uncharacterized protein n=1 Tax=Variovorax paradoxus TaxID=34073 RepID=A0A2W5S297_VARPD|nr:MAG: hypothetical protein DI563_05675 [Variovorax paradoxus]